MLSQQLSGLLPLEIYVFGMMNFNLAPPRKSCFVVTERLLHCHVRFLLRVDFMAQ